MPSSCWASVCRVWTVCRLAAFDVGVAHNVIPREGSVSFVCSAETSEQLAARVEQVKEQALGYLPAADGQLEFVLQADAGRQRPECV